ncbi:MAG: zinc ribbon domain-containing protein [Blautia sp.]|nr:zinc ribbon domain-containing protein [Blautia sp.]
MEETKMAFWDKVTETTATGMEKTKEMLEVAKLNSLISEEETKINNIYYQIGKLYVAMHSHDYEEGFVGMITALGEAGKKVKSYMQQVQNIKGVICCARCGAEVKVGVPYCSSCGAPQINLEEMVRCERCGAMVKRNANFCTSCGMPMVKATSEIPNEPTTVVREIKVCSACGAKAENDAIFCIECGNKL